MNMKLAYVAHPIGGDVQANLASLRNIIATINREEPDTVPFCPYMADVVSLDDNIPEERQRGLKNTLYALGNCNVDELRLYGNSITKGMQQEVAIAHLRNIPVRPMTAGTLSDYEQLNND